jgi:hypothetical protein
VATVAAGGSENQLFDQLREPLNRTCLVPQWRANPGGGALGRHFAVNQVLKGVLEKTACEQDRREGLTHPARTERREDLLGPTRVCQRQGTSAGHAAGAIPPDDSRRGVRDLAVGLLPTPETERAV